MLSSFLFAASGSARSQIVRSPPFVRQIVALRGNDDVGIAFLRIVDDTIAGGFDQRPEHVLHPRIPARQCGRRAAPSPARQAPTWLAKSQCASTSSAGSPLISDTPLTSPGRSAWMTSLLDRREVDDLGEGIADLVIAIVEPEQPDLAGADFG